ncbi:MAG TPA: hypothetical protein VNK03_06235 [Gammaproteobacteria bacterium]|nr:hypothetical protein [Gammaproteobacteria bacterium]
MPDRQPPVDNKPKKPGEALPSYDESQQAPPSYEGEPLPSYDENEQVPEEQGPPSFEESRDQPAPPPSFEIPNRSPPSYEEKGKRQDPPSFADSFVENAPPRYKQEEEVGPPPPGYAESVAVQNDKQAPAHEQQVPPPPNAAEKAPPSYGAEKLTAMAQKLQKASTELKAAASKPGIFNFFSTKKQTRRAEMELLSKLKEFQNNNPSVSPLAKAIVTERVLLAISRDLQTEKRVINKKSRLATQVDTLLEEAKNDTVKIKTDLERDFGMSHEQFQAEAASALKNFAPSVSKNNQAQKKYKSILEHAKDLLPNAFMPDPTLKGAKRKPGH